MRAAISQDVRSIEPWLLRFRAFLIEHSYSQSATKNYYLVVRNFLSYLEQRAIEIETVRPTEVDAYLNARLRRYQRQFGHKPRSGNDWYWHFMSPIQALLRLAQGQWPPLSAIDSRLAWFRTKLVEAHHTPGTVRHYTQTARKFLTSLDRQSISIEAVQPLDVSRFIEWELTSFRRKQKRLPDSLVDWRCGLTSGVHALLRLIQGKWPPSSSVHPWLLQLRRHLEQECPDRRTRLHYLHECNEFVAFCDARGVAPESVEAAHVAAYCGYKLRAYRKRHHRSPRDLHRWRLGIQTPIHRLLRLKHGYWPPESRPDPSVIAFREHLVQEGFQPSVIPTRLSTIRVFLRFLRMQQVAVEEVQPTHVALYLESRLAAFRRTYRRLPANLNLWRYGLTGPIHRYLRLVRGKWPPEVTVTDELEVVRGNLCAGYGRWLIELKGLSQETLRKNGDAAKLFLRWLGERARPEVLRNLTVSDIDAFLAWRNPGLRRATRSGVSHCFRSLLRYLYAEALIAQDLARQVPSPNGYRFEDIPCALSSQQVRRLLEVTRTIGGPLVCAIMRFFC